MESQDAFREIETLGMAAIGVGVQFDMDGGSYSAVASSPDAATQMLTGGFQGRSAIILLATKSQFPDGCPSQRGDVTVTDPMSQKPTLWNRKEVAPDGANHYAITLVRQIPA